MQTDTTPSAADGHNQLSSALKTRHLTMMSIAGVIGAALFVGSGSVIAQAGPATILAYLAGGILVILIMRMLGEMATSSPDTGSFSTYAEKAIGRWAGFTIGWLYWWFWTLLMAWEAYVAGLILHDWFPAIGINAFTAIVTGLLIIVNFLQVRSYGEFEFWFALIKVVAIACFIALGVLAVLNLWPWGESRGIANLTAHGGFMPNGIESVAVALLGVMFAFLGAEIVTIAASEAKNPAEQIVRATNSVVWRICLFYIGSIFLIVCLVPWNDPLLGQSGYGSYRRTLELLGIPGAQWVMNFVVLTSVSSCFISAHYTCSRMLYSLARRGDAPAFLQQTRANGTPVYAVIASCAVAVLIAILNFFESLRPKDILDLLMNTTGMIALLVYLVVAFSQLKMRRKLEAQGREIRLKMWLFPWLTYATIVFIIASLVVMLFVDQYRPIVLSTGAAALVVVIAGIVVHLREARRQRHAANRTDSAGSADIDATVTVQKA
ncbi:amino acid permease [Corticibacter populi]|uniref:Amino acid permease n=1 Tax=Corticibacter populi TaxID=1550736 RepID=A0A3M6QV38_9BURK|nr:amino acid permease [Corticibacter populi]RMX06887.1 amino acid permease [Corticibacter populi]RZS32100.1 gamma-aminobutyrate:proton symporter (AAT family) [Corticibacter populi]